MLAAASRSAFLLARNATTARRPPILHLLVCATFASGWLPTASAASPTMSPLVRLHADDPSCQGGALAFAQPDTSVVTLWQDWSGNGLDGTRWRLLGANATPQGDGPVAHPGRELLAAVAGDDGSTLAVWRTEAAVVLEALTADGHPSETTITLPIDHTTASVGFGRNPTNGQLLFAWREGTELVTQLFDAAGLPAGPRQLLGTATYHRPTAAFDHRGRPFVTWAAGGGLTSVAKVQFLSAAGVIAGAAITVSGDLAAGFDSEPVAVAQTGGGLFVAWIRRTGETPDSGLYLRELAADGTFTGPSALQSNDQGFSPRLAVGPRGAVALGWEGHDPEAFRYRALLRLVRGPGAGDQTIPLHPENPPGAGVEDGPPELTFLPDGRLAAVWTTFYLSAIIPTGCENLGVFARVIDPAPRRTAPRPTAMPFLAGTTAATSSYPAALAGADDGSWLVAWQDASCGPLRGRVFRPNDAALGPTRLLGNLPCSLGDAELQATSLAGGGFALVWEATRDAGAIALLRLDGNGEPVAEPLTVTAGPANNPRVVRAGDGGFVVGWVEASGALRLQAFSPAGLPAPATTLTTLPPTATFWDLLALPGGGLVAAWNAAPGTILARRLRSDGSPRGEPVEVVVDPLEPQVAPHLAATPGGGFAVAWTSFAAPFRFGAGARLQRFGPDGRPHGPRIAVADLVPYWAYDDDSTLEVVDLVNSTDGTSWVTYRRTGSRDRLEAIAVAGKQVVGPPIVLAEDAWLLVTGQSLAQGCSLLTAWKEPEASSGRVVAQRFAGACLDEPTQVAVRGGRFTLTARWQLPDGRRGEARGWPLGDDSAALWFFNPNNPEIFVKLLDGAAVNGSFWLFQAALTSAAVELEIVDTVTGEQRSFRKEAGAPASSVDLTAFPSLSGLALAPAATSSSERARRAPHLGASAPVAVTATAPPCGASAAAPCLLDDRYQVGLRFTDPRDGSTHDAIARSVGADGLGFWFFRADALEVLVKVLDGRGVNGHDWVFHAGLSNLAWELTVTDTTTGAVWRHHNPRGSLAADADITAFDVAE